MNVHIEVWLVFELYINGIFLSIPLHFASLLDIVFLRFILVVACSLLFSVLL